MPGLVLEGGTFRPVFSCGVMDALLDNDIMFDYVTYAASYLSRQRERNINILRQYRGDKRYFGARNLLHDHSIFGTDFVFDTIPNQLVPFDCDEFHKYQGKCLVGVTNAKTGKAEYLDGMRMDRLCTMLRATCAIPIYFPPVQMDGETYYDGGLADPIPILRSLHDGNERNLIVLTQPESYRKTLGRGVQFTAKWLKRKYPAMPKVLLERAKHYNETVCFCHRLAENKPQDTVLLQPEKSLNSFEKDVKKLEWGYEMGYNMTCARMEQIKNLFR